MKEALRAARSVGAESLRLGQLELARLRARGRAGLRQSLAALWIGVALLAATWAGAMLAVRGLAEGLNALLGSTWAGDLLAPLLLFGSAGGAVAWRLRARDRQRARALRERFGEPAGPAVPARASAAPEDPA